MAEFVSDLGDSINELSEIHKAIRERKIDPEVGEEMKKEQKAQITSDVHSLYYRYDGKFDTTAYKMHKPNGALIVRVNNRTFVELEDENDPNSIEMFEVRSPGPDRDVMGY